MDRQHCTMALQELTAADEILARYLGPTHLIRKDLARMIKDLTAKLDCS